MEENNSFAFEILKDYKKQNKRQFIVILVILIMWFATIGYLVYTLNDIGNYEIDEQSIKDVETIENSNIQNGSRIWEQ